MALLCLDGCLRAIPDCEDPARYQLAASEEEVNVGRSAELCSALASYPADSKGERHGTRNLAVAARSAHPDHHHSIADIPSLIDKGTASALDGIAKLEAGMAKRLAIDTAK